MRKWLIAIVIIVGISLITGFVLEKIFLPIKIEKDSVKNYYLVTKVIDGDTIKINNEGREESVRLLGIDAPELNDKRKLVACFANESKNELSKKISNQKVELESDLSQGDKDKYGRLLRYIYFNGELINSWLIKEGYANVYRQYPVAKLKEFEGYEMEARLNSRGLWGNECN